MSQKLNTIKKRASLWPLLGRKLVYSLFRKKNKDTPVIFILGCQRSGTTLLTDIFQKDVRAKIFGEFSELSDKDPAGIRLNPFAEIESVFEKLRYSLIVAKPIVESQNALALLNHFPYSKAMWIYRDFKDVASSNIKKFGLSKGLTDLKPIIENDPDNWRSQNISQETKKIVNHYYGNTLKPHDAAALFWYVRNKLFIDLDLKNAPRVVLIKYEDLVSDPAFTMKKIYAQVGLPYPGDKIVASVHSKSVKKGSAVDLSDGIENLCQALYADLEAIYFG
jgi:hypothetical protein